MIKAAAIQMVSSPVVDENLETATTLIKQAVKQGAAIIVLPENFALFGASKQELLKNAERDENGKIQKFLQQQAKQGNVWIIGGTIPLLSPDKDKVFASCLVFNASGEQVARYDKIHLFDADVNDEVKQYRESAHTHAGDKLVTLATPFGRIGLSVCYDLRFPELYRQLVKQKAEIFVIPSAFTYETGLAHWEILLKARAIENACFIIAPNQGGIHANNRQTYGHTLIIDPWGKTLAQRITGEGMILAEIDLATLNDIRKKMPFLNHMKLI